MDKKYSNMDNLKNNDQFETADKEAYTRQLFTVVAPVYSLVARLLSFNRDQAWKRKLIRLLPATAPDRVLDLACGNGDITWLLARRYPQAELWGIDLNPVMLGLARHRFRNLHLKIRFLEESMISLSAPADHFDLVTGGYALRNAPDLTRALQEVKRVLKKGGTAAFLDFSKSAFKPLQTSQIRLLRLWGCFWGWIFHRNPAVYGYIADSLDHYPDRSSLTQLLTALGFKNIRTHLLFGGFTSLTLFTK